MENYPSNAKTTRTDRVVRVEKTAEESTTKPKIEKIVTGDVIRRKKSLGTKIRAFLVGENAQSVWGYVVEDVLVPAAKDMIVDAVTSGVERRVFGIDRPSSRKSSPYRPGNGGFVSYNRFGGNSVSSNRSAVVRSNSREEPRRVLSSHARRNHDFGEIVLATRAEGNQVIDRLFDLVSQYGQASVNDLYEMIGVTGDYPDEQWGWENLQGATVRRTRDGYLLELPKPEPLS